MISSIILSLLSFKMFSIYIGVPLPSTSLFLEKITSMTLWATVPIVDESLFISVTPTGLRSRMLDMK